MTIRSVRRLLLLCLLAGCRRAPEPALQVGELAFSPGEVASLAPEARTALADLAALGLAVSQERVDSLVAPLVARETERARWEALPYHLAAERMGLGEERLRAAYAADPEWELEVRHLVRLVPRWAPERDRAAQRALAAEAARRAHAGEDFAALAAELSEEPGAARRGGLLEPGREGTWVRPFWEAAHALRPGEASGVVETEYGYHVLRLEARRPIDFAEADRLRLLHRLVPQPQAGAAMQEWLEAQPTVALDPPAVLQARALLLAGRVPDDLVLTAAGEPRPYTGRDLAADWAALDPEERAGLQRAGDQGFGQWAEMRAQEAAWAEAARRLGVRTPRAAEANSLARWRQQVAGWAQTLGAGPGQPPREVREAALRAAAAGGQEARIVRARVAGLRPLLRRLYEVREPPPGDPSSSDIR
jgi:hypothetical protein